MPRKFYRIQLRREDFLTHFFAPRCPGCQETLRCTSRQGHSERCRRRMDEAIRSSPEGQVQASRRKEKDNDSIARNTEEEDDKHKQKELRREEKRVRRGRRRRRP